MDNRLTKRKISRKRRTLRVRKKIRGSSLVPRFSVYKSNSHLYAQLIDDENGTTLAGVGTQSKKFQKTEFNKKSKLSAREIGKHLADVAKTKEIKRVIFDRGRFKFHGLIAELANAAREAGLQF
jgi:large subunit ribosomal protein L18